MASALGESSPVPRYAPCPKRSAGLTTRPMDVQKFERPGGGLCAWLAASLDGVHAVSESRARGRVAGSTHARQPTPAPGARIEDLGGADDVRAGNVVWPGFAAEDNDPTITEPHGREAAARCPQGRHPLPAAGARVVTLDGPVIARPGRPVPQPGSAAE